MLCPGHSSSSTTPTLPRNRCFPPHTHKKSNSLLSFMQRPPTSRPKGTSPTTQRCEEERPPQVVRAAPPQQKDAKAQVPNRNTRQTVDSRQKDNEMRGVKKVYTVKMLSRRCCCCNCTHRGLAGSQQRTQLWRALITHSCRRMPVSQSRGGKQQHHTTPSARSATL